MSLLASHLTNRTDTLNRLGQYWDFAGCTEYSAAWHTNYFLPGSTDSGKKGLAKNIQVQFRFPSDSKAAASLGGCSLQAYSGLDLNTPQVGTGMFRSGRRSIHKASGRPSADHRQSSKNFSAGWKYWAKRLLRWSCPWDRNSGQEACYLVVGKIAEAFGVVPERCSASCLQRRSDSPGMYWKLQRIFYLLPTLNSHFPANKYSSWTWKAVVTGRLIGTFRLSWLYNHQLCHSWE